MTNGALTFHLRADPEPVFARSGERAYGTEPTVEVPAGPSVLATDAAGAFDLLPATDAHEAVCVVEPVMGSGRPRLTLLCAPGAPRVRVNGLPGPRLSVLEPGDQVQLGSEAVLHVLLHRQPYVGPAGEARAGKKCPVCSVAVAADDVVHDCVNCGTTYHVRSSPTGDGDADPLECLSCCTACTVCSWTLDRTEGFLPTPELE